MRLLRSIASFAFLGAVDALLQLTLAYLNPCHYAGTALALSPPVPTALLASGSICLALLLFLLSLLRPQAKGGFAPRDGLSYGAVTLRASVRPGRSTEQTLQEA